MAAGKRYDKTEPLTEHDVAERLSKAMHRVWRILLELDDPEVARAVCTSRYMSVMPAQLVEALQEFEALSRRPAAAPPVEQPSLT